MKKHTRFLSTALTALVLFSCTVMPFGNHSSPTPLIQILKAEAVDCVDDYPQKYKNCNVEAYVADEWNYFARQCTSFVAWRLNSRNGVAFHNRYGGAKFGNADSWGNAARSIGITVDMNPAPGSVFWQDSCHVAWVNEVYNNGTVLIEEYNWYVNGAQDGAYHSRIVPISDASGYIHIKDLTIPSPDPVQIPQGTYSLENFNGHRLNFDYGTIYYSFSRGNLYKVTENTPDNQPEQNVTAVSMGSLKFGLFSCHEKGGCLNSYCESVAQSGTDITSWFTCEDDTQMFYFCKGDGDYYYIASATNRNVVLTTSGGEFDQIKLRSFTGEDNQKWRLIDQSQAQETTATITPTITTTTTTAEPPRQTNFICGVDVSEFQGDIDWNSVKHDGIDFSIIRAATTNINSSDGFRADEYFESNYKNAKAAGLKIGAYLYTSANSKDEMRENINNLLTILEGKQFDLPVYLDIESSRQKEIGKEALTEVVSYGCSLLRAAGYLTGAYTNLDGFRNYLDADPVRSDGADIWMAAYPYTNRPADPADYDYSDFCSIWQYSDSGSVAGISTKVDLDVYYGTFEEPTETTSVTTTNTTTTTTTVTKPVNLGDINCDGKVDGTDVQLMIDVIAGRYTPSVKGFMNADVNGDDNIDNDDLEMLKTMVGSSEMIGDVDCNSIRDVADVVLLARFLVEDKDAAVSEQGRKNADCNQSGVPDSNDIVMILKAIAKLITL